MSSGGPELKDLALPAAKSHGDKEGSTQRSRQSRDTPSAQKNKPPGVWRRGKPRYIRGPIPAKWLQGVSSLTDKSAAVAMALWEQASLQSRLWGLTLTKANYRPYGVGKGARDRALARMAEQSFIKITPSDPLSGKASKYEILPGDEIQIGWAEIPQQAPQKKPSGRR